MKKYLIIALFIIFTLVCFSGNTYSALNVYPCDAEIYAYITQADDHSYVSILYLSNGTDFKLDNEEEYEKGIYSIVAEDKYTTDGLLPIPNSLQEKVKKYRSSFRTTLYIKGSDQQLNELQNFLETFDFHIVVIGDTSFDILGRIDKKVVVLPIQKI